MDNSDKGLTNEHHWDKRKEQLIEEATRLLLGQRSGVSLPEDESGDGIDQWSATIAEVIFDIARKIGSVDTSKKSPTSIAYYLQSVVAQGGCENYLVNPNHPTLGTPNPLRLEFLADRFCADFTHLAYEFAGIPSQALPIDGKEVNGRDV